MMRFICVAYGILVLGTLNAMVKDPVSIPIVDALKETCGRTTLKGDPLTIVGGELAGEGEFPWIVSFQTNVSDYLHYCGGSILSDHWILTAAHCFTSYDQSNDFADALEEVSILMGVNNNMDSYGDRYKLEKIIIHEKFKQNDTTILNDIALVQTKKKINFQKTDANYKVNSVCLPPYKSDSVSYPPNTAVIAGWGRTEYDGSASAKLLKVKVPLVDHQKCLSIYGNDLSNQTICYGEGGKGSCQSDSGGPLQKVVDAQSHLIGVVSFGVGCGKKEYPVAFTEVYAYRNWIRDNIF